MRLQKYLSQAGVASRRKCEEYISQGRIKINGEIITSQGIQVEEADKIMFDNKIVSLEKHKVYYVLNKPTGCVTTVSDENNRKTVMDILPPIKERIFPVGRLDFNTSGLLIFTNDGDLTYKLTHPKHELPKTYMVTVKGRLPADLLLKLEIGVDIGGYITLPAYVNLISQLDTQTVFELTIMEGKNRQIRRMCEAIGYEVISLKRIGIGKLTLSRLKNGEIRMLTKNEINYLKNL
ncbi:pseudouridine synthase [Candidatus Epulonipiscium fishelsonii]|uniref:Pseudouridine synthase n=1 Tax=Candidatus Epulonipiscium fishelsonii TaxID=77094 RepID=A0ACC8XET4_9FIRM|nr:pseudouridine synthase [Epulopiscium sp. SCG-B05WGA-EpuloA1]ONI41804.1 pseudouridine synthase [Epulopiscium sp. SCG-B11WGA-EpuloA1]